MNYKASMRKEVDTTPYSKHDEQAIDNNKNRNTAADIENTAGKVELAAKALRKMPKPVVDAASYVTEKTASAVKKGAHYVAHNETPAHKSIWKKWWSRVCGNTPA